MCIRDRGVQSQGVGVSAKHFAVNSQIQLTESTLAQSFIHLGTVSFLRVYSKVLGTYTHALALHTRCV